MAAVPLCAVAVRRCLCFGRGFFLVGLLHLVAHDEVCHRGSHEERGEGSEDDTQNHGEREAADAVTSEDEDADEHDERTLSGVERTCQGGVQ